MSKVLQHKVVAALPSPLEPDSIYYVRKGAGFDIHVTNGVGVVTAYSLNADVKLDGKVDSTDPRLTDSREWSEETVAQEEAEAGTASTRRAWTAQRVWQAINAWWQLVTSGFGRNFIAATNEQAARSVLQLTYPATAPTVGDGNEVLRAGAGGWLGSGEGSETVALTYPTIDFGTGSIQEKTKITYSAIGDNGVAPYATTFQFGCYSIWGRLRIGAFQSEAWLQGGLVGGSTDWTARLYHSLNTLDIGKTAATARTALQLTGNWVDLRPYLKSGFYYDSARNGRNSHPRIRKLSCGRVELDGIVSFNATSGPVPIGVFVNVPAEFRPTLTVGGLMFGDTASPLSFGSCNWLVMGEVEYSPPRVHGDIMMIPLTLASPAQSGALSLNGIYWFT